MSISKASNNSVVSMMDLSLTISHRELTARRSSENKINKMQGHVSLLGDVLFFAPDLSSVSLVPAGSILIKMKLVWNDVGK